MAMMTRRALCVLLLPLLSVLLAAALVRNWQQGEELLIQRQYQQAVVVLEQGLAATPEAERDRVWFLLGRARFLAGDANGAIDAFRQLQQQHPGSRWVAAGRFQEARALERSGDRRGAAAIFRDEVERLVGSTRTDEVAAIYLGLANKALATDPPDHARAVRFFDLALDLGLLPAMARGMQLKAAESQLALRDFNDAIQRLLPLTKEPDDGDVRQQALLLLGRARRSNGENAAARVVLRDLVQLADATQIGGDAAYEIALTFGVPTPAPADVGRAIAALRDLATRFPGHPQSRRAAWLAGLCFRHVGRGDDALAELQRFLAEQGDSGLEEVAAARAAIGDVLLAQGKPEPAIAAFRDYLRLHPAHGQWERVQRAIVDAEYGMAAAAWKAGKERFAEARIRFLEFAAAYPLDPRNPDILVALGDMLEQEERFDEAREAYARCVSKYPGKEAASAAQFAIGRIFEQKTFNYEQALAAYKLVTWGSQVGPARERIAQLTRKALRLRTERIFLSGEDAGFELVSRNIDKVRVRVFRLDLEEYFRATHQTGGQERLDIEVIEADKTFDSAVVGYARHRETRRVVPIGFTVPGAYIVKVDDRELEATTMVLVSDLALIAKSSRHELLVLVQDQKQQRVVGGARVVVSDGQKVVAEGRTGADGVFRWRDEQLKNLDGLRVFAVDASGSGAGTLDLSGLGYSTGMVAKGYLFTDRPLYQPGQRVHLKGIVREVKDGVYCLPGADGYRVLVRGPDGRLLLQRDVRFTAFGSFATELDLPPDAALGDWQIAVDREGRSDVLFTGSFHVARYERPRLSLAIELERPLVFRGEPIEGRIQARHFYGEPAVGKPVAYSLQQPDGAVVQRTGITDANGEVAFQFATGEFGEEALAVLSASLPADGVSTAVAVPVVTTELVPEVRTMRSVYLAGETFDVDVVLQDRAGKPLARAAEVILLRIEASAKPHLSGAGAVATEVEVARLRLSAGNDGKARGQLAALQGGRHRLRVAVVDRFGTTVTGERELTISGADDEVKLRLLGDRETYRVGETAEVKVVNRAGARLALLCWQGDGILAYETRQLSAGESLLRLPLAAVHAPNFALAVAMVDGNRLHTAEREFRVQRDLQVALTVPATGRPGAKVDLAVETRDAEGRPVAAEVAIAMVDEAVLALRQDSAPAIGAFFHGQLRETSFRTVSSCTWSHDGRSRPVSAELLAESRRIEAERLRAEIAANAVGDPRSDGADHRGFMPGGGAGGGLGLSPGDRPALRQADRLNRAPAEQAVQDRVQLFAEQTAQQLQAGELFFARNAGAQEAGGGWAVRRFAGDDEAAHFNLGFAGLPAVVAAPDQPRTDFRETGAWISSLVTGADGRATVALQLPHATTGHALHARGVTVATDVGEGKASLRTQQELQVEPIGPSALTEGDEVRIALRGHNLTGDPLDGACRHTVTGGAVASGSTPWQLPARGDVEVPLVLQASQALPIELRVDATAGAFADTVQRQIPVQPFGVEWVASRTGSTRDQAAFALSLPAGRDYTALELVIELGPDPARDLLSVALGTGYQPSNCRQVAVTALAQASRGLGALALLEHLEQGGGGSKVDQTMLRALAQAMVQALVGSQRDDGSFAWVGRQNADLRSTCQALRLFAVARRRGFPVADEVQNRAAEWLLQALRQGSNAARADALHALATVDRARFEALNSLHRARGGLSVEGLARLGLAFHEARRPELLPEVLETLRAALRPDGFAKQPLEAVALAARALLLGDKRDPLGTAAATFVAQQRTGASFGTPEATAAALAVLTMVRSGAVGAPAATEVVVTVNGHRLAEAPKEAAATSSRFVVPAEWLRPVDNAVQLAVRGGGESFFQATLVGFARGFTAADRNDASVKLQRSYLAAPRRHADRDVPTGFSVLQGSDIPTFENKITQLRVGDSCRVRVGFRVATEDDRRSATPLVLEEPIPAGCAVPRASIQGPFEHVEVLPDRLLCYFRDGIVEADVTYQLQARFAGRYRALPTRVQGALRPEFLAHGTVGELVVHPAGEGGEDAYRLTPDELYHLGKACYDAAQSRTGDERMALLAQSHGHLSTLLGDWQQKQFSLREAVWNDVARMSLFLGIERGDGRAVVRFFEELKERHGDLVIPFDRIVAVGKAYLELGEAEAALLVFRATAEASFLKEAGVATTLEQLGELRAATLFLERLLQVYPDLNTMRVARYSIGQKLSAQAAAIDPAAPVDPRIGSEVELRNRALAAFREFLVLYPEDPLAEEVSFAWATTHVEQKALDRALAVATQALARYPDSPFTDELLYTQGYAWFVLGKPELAFAALQRVAEEQFATDRGGRAPSDSRWHAVYLQGQIHHARGEPAAALGAYAKVKDRFTDAGEAADYFLRKQLSLPEASTIPLAQPAQLLLMYRNVAKVDVQVYRVDLMRLYLQQKSLAGIGGVQLHGIRPLRQFEIALGDGRDYRNKERAIALDLPDPGAYLVVVRGDDQIASGMLLRSDLSIEAQEQFDVGRIRVNCKQGDDFVADAHVKVIGSGDRHLSGGDTDLRGLFVGQDLVGTATVIARKGDQYAFYRGTGVHQPERLAPAATRQPSQQEGKSEGQSKVRRDFDALEGNLNLNNDNRARQVEWLDQQVRNKQQQQGVEVQKTR